MSDPYRGWSLEQIEARVAYLSVEVFEIERFLAQMDAYGYDSDLNYAPTYGQKTSSPEGSENK